MRCPACRQEMVIVETDHVELDVCAGCSGTWFDADEMNLLFRVAGLPQPVRDLEAALAHGPARRSASRRRCPRCRRRLVEGESRGEHGPVVIDRCPQGDGLWFDAGELGEILEARLEGDAPALHTVREFLGRFAAVRKTPETRD